MRKSSITGQLSCFSDCPRPCSSQTIYSIVLFSPNIPEMVRPPRSRGDFSEVTGRSRDDHRISHSLAMSVVDLMVSVASGARLDPIRSQRIV